MMRPIPALVLAFAAAFLPLSVLHADVPAAIPPDLSSHYITEDRVTIDELHTLFDQAFIQNDPSNKDGNGLQVDDSGLTIYVQPFKDEKVLQFVATWGFKPKADDAKKLALVNELNDKYIFVRYCSSKNGTILWCDYDLYYGGGILDSQIIRTFREFVTLLNSNTGRFDWNDLVQ